MLEDIANARIPWITDVLVGSIPNPNWVDSPPSLFSHHPVLLDTPTWVSLASISKKIASAIDELLFKQQKFNCI